MRKVMCSIALVAVLAAGASAQNLQVTIENLQSEGGMAFTPFWVGVSDGTFDVFNAGESAASGIEAIAELGDAAPLTADFTAAQPGGTQDTLPEPNGPPVFSPGESASFALDVANPSTYRYLNYASMVVPSNDLFVGRDEALEVFDADGDFLGPFVIDVLGSNVWDAGTEVNDITDGAAFLQGVDASLGTGEGGVVHAFEPDGADVAYLASIIGQTTAPGGTISQTFGADDVIARVTIVPEPATMGLLALGGIALVRRRRLG